DTSVGEQAQGAFDVLGPDDGHHAHSHVERGFHVLAAHLALLGQVAEHGCGCPSGTVQPGVEMVGQGPGQVRHQTATGHVCVGVYVHRLGEGHAVLGVDPGRGEQHLSQNTVELRNV